MQLAFNCSKTRNNAVYINNNVLKLAVLKVLVLLAGTRVKDNSQAVCVVAKYVFWCSYLLAVLPIIYLLLAALVTYIKFQLFIKKTAIILNIPTDCRDINIYIKLISFECNLTICNAYISIDINCNLRSFSQNSSLIF